MLLVFVVSCHINSLLPLSREFVVAGAENRLGQVQTGSWDLCVLVCASMNGYTGTGPCGPCDPCSPPKGIVHRVGLLCEAAWVQVNLNTQWAKQAAGGF